VPKIARNVFYNIQLLMLLFLAPTKPNNHTLACASELWIFTHRQKTETASRIPLLPISQELIVKYAAHPQCVN
jgi:hypothetical protein